VRRLANNGTCGLRFRPRGFGQSKCKGFQFLCDRLLHRVSVTSQGDNFGPTTYGCRFHSRRLSSFLLLGYQSRQRPETTSSVTIHLFGSLPKWSFTVCKWIGWPGSASLYGSFRSHANFPQPGLWCGRNVAAVKQPNDSQRRSGHRGHFDGIFESINAIRRRLPPSS
jgi:hypothetical protein